jgi:hypothetical protein
VTGRIMPIITYGARPSRTPYVTRNEAGELIANPDARWAISDRTREKIKQIVADAFSAETPLEEVKSAIQAAAEGNGIFSPARAEMIARTETMRSQVAGNVAVWKKSGLVEKVRWMVSNLEPCDASSPYFTSISPKSTTSVSMRTNVGGSGTLLTFNVASASEYVPGVL